MSKEINRSKQFSLFVPHEAPVIEEPEVEQVILATGKTDKPASIARLYSETAAKILREREHGKDKKEVVRHVSDDFKLDSCRACKSTRLMHIDNVYVCRTCGAENTYSGVLFGDKHKKGDKS